MARVFNFSAGPATLPEEVLRQAAEEMLDWGGTGQSVMEMSHRGKDFMSIAAAAEADLRELLAIPDYYRVLFLQGGASLQFAPGQNMLVCPYCGHRQSISPGAARAPGRQASGGPWGDDALLRDPATGRALQWDASHKAPALQEIPLEPECLLGAEQVRIERLDRFDHELPAQVPVVRAILRRSIADVERHHPQRLRRRGSDLQGER